MAERSGKPSPLDLAERASKAEGLTDVDLNYPDHVGSDPCVTGDKIRDLGLAVNGLAMRYYSNPAFKIGAFTNPDQTVRREAIDLTRRGIDAARQAGCNLMTLWLGQDGFDYAFQADYARLWAEEIDGIREVALHDPDCLVSVEYKPNEPRSYSLMPDCATTLLALKEVGLPNVGVTLDFAHVLYADEQPAFAAALINRHSRLLGMHLNDGYSKRDDGLMVGQCTLSRQSNCFGRSRSMGSTVRSISTPFQTSRASIRSRNARPTSPQSSLCFASSTNRRRQRTAGRDRPSGWSRHASDRPQSDVRKLMDRWRSDVPMSGQRDRTIRIAALS